MIPCHPVPNRGALDMSLGPFQASPCAAPVLCLHCTRYLDLYKRRTVFLIIAVLGLKDFE